MGRLGSEASLLSVSDDLIELDLSPVCSGSRGGQEIAKEVAE